jgi:hypothetical protein
MHFAQPKQFGRTQAALVSATQKNGQCMDVQNTIKENNIDFQEQLKSLIVSY